MYFVGEFYSEDGVQKYLVQIMKITTKTDSTKELSLDVSEGPTVMYRILDMPNPLRHHPAALEKVALQKQQGQHSVLVSAIATHGRNQHELGQAVCLFVIAVALIFEQK